MDEHARLQGATPASVGASTDEASRLRRAIQGDGSMVDAAALDRLKDFCVLEQLAETAKKAVEACGIPGDQACYICLDDGGSEGLVRMCAPAAARRASRTCRV